MGVVTMVDASRSKRKTVADYRKLKITRSDKETMEKTGEGPESLTFQPGERANQEVKEIKATAPEKPKTRVASYSRVSSLFETQKTSIENQETHFNSTIKSNPDWEFVGSYVEEGLSGTKADIRTELQRLLKDCREGRIDLILTKSISRFARNAQECLEMVRELNSLGVHIWFEKENIHTDSMESEFMLSLLSTFAEDESKSISDNLKWGIRRRFEAGTYKQAVVPYGYKYDDGTLVINPGEADVVREIFLMAANGKGCFTIARELNTRKIPSPTGKMWDKNTIMTMIANVVYVGDTLYQKTFMDEKYRQVRNNGELDKYYDEGHHEPIVSKEIFEAAQAMVKQRGKEVGYSDASPKTRSSQHYCFSRVLKCKACGSPMHRQSREYTAWICHKHWIEPDKCQMKPVGDADLKAAFVKCLNKLAWSQRRPDGILDVYERLLGQSEAEKNARRLQEIDELLKENRSESRQLNAVIMRDGFLPEHREKKMFLENQAKTLISEKNKILINGEPTGTLQQLKEFAKGWVITDDVDAFPGEMFSEFVEVVEVDSGKMAYFKFKCGLLLIESIEKMYPIPG